MNAIEDYPCVCEYPGFCPRFGIHQAEHHLKLCRDEMGKEIGRLYRKEWAERKAGKVVYLNPPEARPPAEPEVAVFPPKRTTAKALETYRAFKDRQAQKCRHLGLPLDRDARCSLCGQRELLLPVYGCSVYQECTLQKRATGIAGCCFGCKDFTPKPEFDSLKAVVLKGPPEALLLTTRLLPSQEGKLVYQGELDENSPGHYLVLSRDPAGWLLSLGCGAPIRAEPTGSSRPFAQTFTGHFFTDDSESILVVE